MGKKQKHPAGERIPKIGGTDHEFGNFILGKNTQKKTDEEASRAILRQIPGHSAGYAGKSTPYVVVGPVSKAIDSYFESQYGNWSIYGSGQREISTDHGRRFLTNGGCCYIDSNKLEYATPEVRSASDYVGTVQAMYSIVRDAAIQANTHLPDGQKIIVIANNSDGNGNAWGTHINVAITRQTWENIFHRRMHYAMFLASHLASSLVYTGSGKVGSESPWEPDVDFQIGCRAGFFQMIVNESTMHDRPIVNSRDEPLCGKLTTDSESIARLHTITYDANLSQVSNYLKFGCLQIVAAMIEADFVDTDLIMKDPVQSIMQFSHDPTLQTNAETLAGNSVTAVEHQMMLLEQAQMFADAGELDGIVPGYEAILDLWGDTLNKLHNQDFQALSKRLDWVLKLQCLLTAMDSNPELTWQSPEIKHLDFAYANLDQADGLYWHYERAGQMETIVDSDTIARFITEPPTDTRAYGRAALLAKAPPDSIASVNWDRIKFKLRNGIKREYRILDFGGPLNYSKEHIENLLGESDSLSLSDLLDKLGAETK